MKKIVLVNRRLTVREVAEDLSISIGSHHSIFINDLDMTRVVAKFVAKLLNFDQKQHRIFGQKQHTSNAAATVFPRSGPWLFLVSETEKADERTTPRYN